MGKKFLITSMYIKDQMMWSVPKFNGLFSFKLFTLTDT